MSDDTKAWIALISVIVALVVGFFFLMTAADNDYTWKNGDCTVHVHEYNHTWSRDTVLIENLCPQKVS